MKRILVLLGVVLFVLVCSNSSDSSSSSGGSIKTDETTFFPALPAQEFPAQVGKAEIAKWQGNTRSALLMYFDDSTPGQAELAVPLLNQLKLTGTFFVNPGATGYLKHPTVWEHASQKKGGGCQELANHSMHHTGAANYAEAVNEIEEPSKIIWQARGETVNNSLVAFNNGGGTDWNITPAELAKILTEHRNINRLKNYLGEPMLGTQVLPGSNANTILRNKDKALDDKKILMLSFHGIAATDGNPPKDWGNGAVYIKEFKKAMQHLRVHRKNLWSAGYTQLHKYIWERKMATLTLTKDSQEQYTLQMSFDKSKNTCSKNNEPPDPANNPIKELKYYDEPLTILARLPKNWYGCEVTQGGKKLPHSFTDGKLQFDALPKSSLPVIITQKKADFYVASDGSDSNAGTSEKPFATITKAVQALSAGGVILVQDGDYKEYINIKKSGTAAKPIAIVAANKGKAKVLGFRILKNGSVPSNYIRINGFEIESNMKYPNDKKGVMNYGGSHLEISDCYIHDCPAGGIAILHNAPHTLIKNNMLEHNGSYGILMDANNGIIENNVITRTVQNHPKFTAAQIPQGADADGIVIFGKNHKIRYNKILDLAEPASENTDPHSDGIQSSSNATNTVLQDSEIYGNYIRIKYKSGKGVILEANKSDPCKNIVIANNIIEFTDIGVNASDNGTYENIKIYNNILKSNLVQSSWGVGVWLKNISNYEFINNITIDCKQEHRKITGGSGTVDYNLSYNSDGSAFSMTPQKQTNEITADPKFVLYTGKHGENNYRLKSDSPALNKGNTLSGTEAVTKDFAGKTRPSAQWDIGAYER